MFDQEHHCKILRVLDALDPSIFEKTGSYFGGGTLIALLHDEYRWSKDIDFLCPVGPGYRDLRKVAAEAGHSPTFLFQNVDDLEFPRELRADQYGIRFLVMADGTPIKFEIVAEARIELGKPEKYPWLNTPCLNRVDRYGRAWDEPSVPATNSDLLLMLAERYGTVSLIDIARQVWTCGCSVLE